MLEERRRHPRLVVPLEVEYLVEGSTSPRLGTIQNLSAGGAAMITEDDLSVGAELLSFRFTIPGRDEEPIEVKAVVVRSETHSGVGRESERRLALTFVYSDDESFKRVQQYVFNRLTTGDRAGAHVPVEKRRIPFREPIVLNYEKYEEFVEAVSENLSMNGLFIRTEEPQRPGTQLSFEFRLGEDLPLIQGQGEVAWRRPGVATQDRPSGMGVRFLRLDVRSRELIRHLVKGYTVNKVLAAESEPQSAGDGPQSGSLSGPEDFALPGAVRPAVARSTTGGGLARLVATTTATVLIGVLSLFTVLRIAIGRPPELPAGLESRAAALRDSFFKAEPASATDPNVQLAAEPTPSELEPVIEAAPDVMPEMGEETQIADAAATTELTTMAEVSSSVAPETSVEAGSKDLAPELEKVPQVVQAWAAAWSDQRVEDYLEFYAHDFEPPSAMNRPEWEAQRRSRLSKPDWIRVTLGSMTQQSVASDRISVSFPQAFESNTFSDNVTKTLDLVWEGSSWKILSETSTS